MKKHYLFVGVLTFSIYCKKLYCSNLNNNMGENNEKRIDI